MASLRRIKLLFLLLSPMLGCSSSSYKIDAQTEGRTQLLVTPDRVILECEYITEYSGDIKAAHGFMIHVLDIKNEVLTISQDNVLRKEDCYNRLKSIGRILESGKKISIGGMGGLKMPPEKSDRNYLFPGLGRFPDNGRSLQFMVIWNEKNMCYNAYSGGQKPCPSDEFPIVK